jgi:hypothetical protein
LKTLLPAGIDCPGRKVTAIHGGWITRVRKLESLPCVYRSLYLNFDQSIKIMYEKQEGEGLRSQRLQKPAMKVDPEMQKGHRTGAP